VARRTMLTAAKGLKTKKVRTGRVAQQLADIKYMGDEPDVKGKNRSELDILKLLNWYNYMCSRSDARQYIETYLKSKGRTNELRALKNVPDVWINLQAGWTARIITRGGLGWENAFELRLRETLDKAGVSAEEASEVKKTVERPVEKPKPNIQDRIADKASDTIGELDELIDKNGWSIDVYDWLTKKQVTPVTARKICDFFKPIADEAMALNHARVISTKNIDKQLIEGYSHLTRIQVRDRAAFYMKLIVDCERFSDVAKKQKTPRRKKVVPVEKKLKGLKFQQESKEYKLVSIKPEKIIGAAELWAFNTKYRTLTVFNAAERSTLDVKGTTIINYNEATSKTYRVGRKTEQHIATALKGAKRAVSKMLEELKTVGLQHRINENTILLRAE
jgi:hypothetical protein